MAPPSVLIVEDEAVTALDLQETIAALGYSVYGPVATGEDALALVASLLPDIVLLDIRLAGALDGIAVAEQLRSTFHVPFLFLTAHSDVETLRQAGGTNPYAYILKPFEEGELAITLQLALSRSTHDRIQAHSLTELTLERDQSRAALASVTTTLQRAEQSRDLFLASLSHELRTPLGSILGSAELLSEGALGGLNLKQQAAVRRIEQNGSRLLSLVARLLDFVALASGRATAHYSVVDIAALCEGCLSNIRQAANTKQLQLSVSAPAGMTMVADQEKLSQILLILLENAVKFTPAGGRVGVIVTRDPDDTSAHFVVWDTGIGIAREQCELLFRPFTQLEAGLSRPYEGVGLGLAIARKLAELQGGSITVESTPGQGSRFTLSFPLAFSE